MNTEQDAPSDYAVLARQWKQDQATSQPYGRLMPHVICIRDGREMIRVVAPKPDIDLGLVAARLLRGSLDPDRLVFIADAGNTILVYEINRSGTFAIKALPYRETDKHGSLTWCDNNAAWHTKSPAALANIHNSLRDIMAGPLIKDDPNVQAIIAASKVKEPNATSCVIRGILEFLRKDRDYKIAGMFSSME